MATRGVLTSTASAGSAGLEAWASALWASVSHHASRKAGYKFVPTLYSPGRRWEAAQAKPDRPRPCMPIVMGGGVPTTSPTCFLVSPQPCLRSYHEGPNALLPRPGAPCSPEGPEVWPHGCSLDVTVPQLPRAHHSGPPRLAFRRHLAALWPRSRSSGPCSLGRLQDTGAWSWVPEPRWAEQAPTTQN